MSKAPTRVVIRVDGDGSIGMGHVVRSLALAEMLGPEFTVVFVIQDRGPAAGSLIQGHGFKYQVLPKSTDFATDARAFVGLVTKDDIVILDGYPFDTAYQRSVKEKARGLVSIDDIHACEFIGNAVINHHEHAKTAPYQTASGTRRCLGPDYALLRKEFFEERPKTPKASGKVEKALICLGGADPGNLSLKVLKSIMNSGSDIASTVIVGAANPHQESLKKVGSARVLVNLSAREMAKAFKEHDLFLGCPSTVSLEAFCTGIPSILGMIADNQVEVGKACDARGAAAYVGPWVNLSERQIAEHCVSLIGNEGERVRQVSIQREMVDGRSPSRIRDLFLKI